MTEVLKCGYHFGLCPPFLTFPNIAFRIMDLVPSSWVNITFSYMIHSLQRFVTSFITISFSWWKLIFYMGCPTTYSLFLTIYDPLNSFTTSASRNKKYDVMGECKDYQIRPNKLSHLCRNTDYSDLAYGPPYSGI